MGHMIDIDYHRKGPVAVSRRATSLPLEPDQDPAWSPAANPAVAALLDHLAEELAREYVRLMEATVKSEPAGREDLTQEA